jgi:hypothetical protein
MAMQYWNVIVEYRRDARANEALRSKRRKVDPSIIWYANKTQNGENLWMSHKLVGASIEAVIVQLPELIDKTRADLYTRNDPISVRIHPAGIAEPLPQLITLSEIGNMLGVTRQRAQQMSQQLDFPRPVARTKNGPIYMVKDIEPLYRERSRKAGKDAKGDVSLSSRRQTQK